MPNQTPDATSTADRARPLDRLVVLGAAGDLVTRHLLPALAELELHGLLPPALRVIGVGREPFRTETYRAMAEKQLAQHTAAIPRRTLTAVLDRLEYHQHDLLEEPDLTWPLGRSPALIYLALPSAVYPAATRALRRAGVAADSRVLLEKPFGHDQSSARELTDLLHTVVPEDEVFRVDHFLYHQSVQDLLAIRLGNPWLESSWNSDHVESVEITWEETATVRGRADFYDQTGALRDMVQSHLLQVLALVAMDLPTALVPEPLHDAKVTLLRHVQLAANLDARRSSTRGRYLAGRVGENAVGPYLDEPGVDEKRSTETYARLELEVRSQRWGGVPFILSTGKALAEERKQVRIRFRPPSGLSTPGSALTLTLSPPELSLDIALSGPDGLPGITQAPLTLSRPSQALRPSARLVLDALAGNTTFAVRDDEVEQCWRIVEPVLASWSQGSPAFQDYAAGSAPPRP